MSFLPLSAFKIRTLHGNLSYDLANLAETTPIADSSSSKAIACTHIHIIYIWNGTCIVLLASTRCYQPLRSLSSICQRFIDRTTHRS
jgi:hypothetical protein